MAVIRRGSDPVIAPRRTAFRERCRPFAPCIRDFGRLRCQRHNQRIRKTLSIRDDTDLDRVFASNSRRFDIDLNDGRILRQQVATGSLDIGKAGSDGKNKVRLLDGSTNRLVADDTGAPSTIGCVSGTTPREVGEFTTGICTVSTNRIKASPAPE